MTSDQKNFQSPATPRHEPVYIDSHTIPDVDEKSIDFLKKIVKNDLRYLEFDEQLTTYSLSGNEIGSLSISVHPFVYKRENCFKISVNSVGSMDDNLFRTELTALVDYKLNTIEQESRDYLTFSNRAVERTITLAMSEDTGEYILSKREKTDQEVLKSSIKLRRSLMTGYISESANILLQRLMIQSNYFEHVAFFTFDSNLNPAKVVYRPLDVRMVKLDDEEIEIRGMQRSIESYGDVPTTWQIYFSPDGHMINRVQIGHPAVSRVVKRPAKIEIDEYLPEIKISKKDLNWEDDMQMRSKYLDRKDELKNDYDQYLTDHPEVKSMMADFLQSVLIDKPNDVVSYSARHFAPYSAKTNSNQFLPSYLKNVNIPRH